MVNILIVSGCGFTGYFSFVNITILRFIHAGNCGEKQDVNGKYVNKNFHKWYTNINDKNINQFSDVK